MQAQGLVQKGISGGSVTFSRKFLIPELPQLWLGIWECELADFTMCSSPCLHSPVLPGSLFTQPVCSKVGNLCCLGEAGGG